MHLVGGQASVKANQMAERAQKYKTDHLLYGDHPTLVVHQDVVKERMLFLPSRNSCVKTIAAAFLLLDK